MKKLLFLFALIMGMVFANAQNPTTHLQFKEVPITGDVVKFVDSLKTKGFVVVREELGVYDLKGNFAGESNVRVLVDSYRGQVTVVTVIFPKTTSWSSLKSEYTTLKTGYIEKYGTPSENYEYFLSPYCEGDDFEMQALELNKCIYYAIWERDEGVIFMLLSGYKSYGGSVVIRYEDKISNENAEKTKNQIIQNDI